VAVIAAASFDGTYTFTSRVKDGQPDMVGWTGTMTIGNGTMSRSYTNPANKDAKFYEGTMKQDGDVYILKLTKAYKAEYIGQEHKNKISVTGNTLTMVSADGKFKEIWTKK
jgi:uncharacterized membrane protein